MCLDAYVQVAALFAHVGAELCRSRGTGSSFVLRSHGAQGRPPLCTDHRYQHRGHRFHCAEQHDNSARHSDEHNYGSTPKIEGIGLPSASRPS